MTDESQDHDEECKLLAASVDDDDGGRSASTSVSRKRCSAQPRSASQHSDRTLAREQRQTSQDLSRSWNGFHSEDQQDTRLCKSMTSKPDLDGYHVNGVDDVILNGEVLKDDASEASQRRLQRRLMTSIFVALVCYITGLLSLVPIQSQYLFRRFAMDYFNLTNVTLQETPCATGQNSSLQDDLNIIQAKTSQQILYMEYAQFFPALFVTVIVGSYADYLGRKYLVLAPLVGAFLKSLVYFLVIYLSLDVNYLYIAYAVDGASGAFYALLLGVSASIADVTTTSRQRVLLFALLEVVLAMSAAVSQVGTGFLIKSVGFTIPACIVCCLMFIGCVSLLIFMPETLRKPEHVVLNPLVHLRKVFGFYLFDGSVLQRGLFWCGLMIFFLTTMIALGKMSVETLYVMNTPFCWDSVKIGIFSGVRIALQNLIGVLSLKFLSKWVRIEVIGLLGLTSGMVAYTLEAFADSDVAMYISALAGVLSTIVSPVARTLLSRMAPAKSQGALFSSVSAIETVCHLTSTTVYNQVYMATLDSFAGAVFLLMAAILLLDFILLVFFTIVSRKTLFYADAQVEVTIDNDIPRPPSLSSPSASSSSADDDETQPLLAHQHNGSPRQNTAIQGEGAGSEPESRERATSTC